MASLFEGLAQGISQGLALKQEKEDKELQKSIIKQQAKLLELQVDAEGRKVSAQQKLGDMMNPPTGSNEFAGQVPTPLQTAGQAPQKKSILDVLSDSSMMPLLNDLGINPLEAAKLQQEQQMQQSGQDMFKNFMGWQGIGGQGGELWAAPPQLGGMSPSGMSIDSTGKMSLNMSDQTPAAVKEGDILGVPRKMQRDLWVKKAQGVNVDQEIQALKITQATLDNQIRLQNIETARREAAKEEQATGEKSRSFENNVRTDLRNIKEALAINNELEGTVLQTGQIPKERIKAMGLWSFIDADKKELVSKAERFNQLATQSGINLLMGLMEKKAFTPTDVKFNAIINNSLSMGKTAQANRDAARDLLQFAVDSASAKGIELPEMEEIKSLIVELESLNNSPAGVAPELWENMTVEEKSAVQKAGNLGL